jgi:hypothetical protein
VQRAREDGDRYRGLSASFNGNLNEHR